MYTSNVLTLKTKTIEQEQQKKMKALNNLVFFASWYVRTRKEHDRLSKWTTVIRVFFIKTKVSKGQGNMFRDFKYWTSLADQKSFILNFTDTELPAQWMNKILCEYKNVS